MPEPDVLVLRPRADFYREVDVHPEDVLLLVEIAETSLRYDRLVKVPLYAAAGIREVWIVDVEGGLIEAHREPGPRATGSQALRPQDEPAPRPSRADPRRLRHRRLTRLRRAVASVARSPRGEVSSPG
jgi:Uma2 family endonuclease